MCAHIQEVYQKVENLKKHFTETYNRMVVDTYQIIINSNMHLDENSHGASFTSRRITIYELEV